MKKAAVLISLLLAYGWVKAEEQSPLPVADGPYKPSWESLANYQCPEWFRDAKFGIWAHWGPQCFPEQGDWYARQMYLEGHRHYKFQTANYGHPSEVGFKDVIHQWKAEKWDPGKLVALYKRAGAKYFLALANHHDNFDLFDSAYQPWNSVKIGPRKDLIGGWAKAARDHGLRFGVSIHAAHAWTWYEPSQGADTKGDKAGLPYDGKLTKADGKGTWWDGLDPQDLYAQNHAPSQGFPKLNYNGPQWNWGEGASIPDSAYCTKFYNRTVDLIHKYHPDLIYFDDTVLPLWPVNDAGLRIAAGFYNSNPSWNSGELNAVIFGKALNEDQRTALVWDIERGIPSKILPSPWQTDTCIGGWHYQKDRKYKTAGTVIQMLADIVSKNGNLLLNIPLRGDGTLDDEELKVVADITAWMDVNSEAIYSTRPWHTFGEGPASAGADLDAQGFNEGKGKPYTAEDIRYTTRNGAVYAIVLGVPTQPIIIKSLAGEKIARVTLLGSDAKLDWKQEDGTLAIQLVSRWPCQHAVAFKIEFGK